MSKSEISELVDHLFRRRSGQLIATLTRILGPENLDLAEDVVQEALVRALELWPFQGVPQNPSAWLIQVAKNRAVDQIRRNLRSVALVDRVNRDLAPDLPFPDDELSMMFLCAHPAIAEESRLALTLKTVGGFGVREIARAFLSEETAIAQRLVRAKKQIREQNLTFEMPRGAELAARLDSVLAVLYLMFTEGYGALRRDLCEEAIRLAKMVASTPATSFPASRALVALFLLQSSRLCARLDERGELLLLADQDRSLWDRELIREGLVWLERAAEGTEVTAYHLEAEIAAVHISGEVDWVHIADLYDQLYALKPSPVIALNRAVAIARRDGPAEGLKAIQSIRTDPTLSRYYLLPAVQGHMWRELGDEARARSFFRQAMDCPCSDLERRHLEREAKLSQTEPKK